MAAAIARGPSALVIAAVVATMTIIALGIGAAQRPVSGGPTTVLTAAPIAGGSPAPSLAAVQQAWSSAVPLDVPLAGSLTMAVQVRAAYSPQAIYFWLRWPDELRETASPANQQQRSTMTWRRTTTIGGCAIVCHTSFSAGTKIDNVQTVAPDVDGHAFTILLNQWRDGWWTLGYSRPLRTASPVDIQFDDLSRLYSFGLDIAAGNASAHTAGEDLTLRFAASRTKAI